MSSCGVCNKLCTDGSDVKCAGSCARLFHPSCVALEGAKTRASKDWKCKDCKQTSYTSSKLSTDSTVLAKDFLIRLIENLKQEISQEFKSVKTDMGELTASVQFLSEKFDASAKIMTEIKQEITDLKRENKKLREESKSLGKRVCELEERVRNMEQYSRKNNIEISGIPTTPNEDVKTIVKDVGTALGLEVEPSQIAAAHRIPTYNQSRTPSVVVQFFDRAVKEDFIAKFKETRAQNNHLTAAKVNKSFPAQRVYVNDHLSPENKRFLAALKVKCKELNFAFVWSRDGKFFVRKTAGDKAIKVSTTDDISKLK